MKQEVNQVAIVGVGATRPGAHPGEAPINLAVTAFREALADAGIRKAQVDAVMGSELAGFCTSPEEFCQTVGLNPRMVESLHYGSAGIVVQHAAMAISSGVCDVVACVLGRNPPGAGEALSGPAVYDRLHGLVNANVVAALGWSRHMARYGTTVEVLAEIAVAARLYARANPLAEFTAPLSVEDYLAEPFLVWPFRSLDIAKSTGCGVCVILARRELARDFSKPPVYLKGMGRRQAARLLENEEQVLCHGMQDAGAQAYDAAGLAPSDVDVVYIYDATTAAVVQSLENYGFCGLGEGADFVADGRIRPGGALALNTHGGHLSGGYAFGWLHHVELVRQLRGEAGDRQIEGARRAHFSSAGRFREDICATVFERE